MLAASGGPAWSDVRTLHLSFRAQLHGVTAKGDQWDDLQGGRYLVRRAWPAYSESKAFDGVTPWRQDRSGIAYTLGDADSGRVAANEAFRTARAWWFPDRHSGTVGYLGQRVANGRSYDILETTPEGGRPFQAWIDTRTHLLFRTDEQQGEDRAVTTYTGYRTVAGIVLPFKISIGDGKDSSLDVVETVTSVEINRPLADNRYSLPPRPGSDFSFPPGRTTIEVPFRLTADTRILVPVSIDGQPTLEAEFDSGGSLLLQPDTVSRLGLAIVGHTRQGGNFEGSITASNGVVQDVAIGGVHVRDVAFDSYPFAHDEPNRMLVGLEILQRFQVTFDFDRSIMTLSASPASVQPPGAVIPFRFQDNQPEVTGALDGIAARLTIDTGDAAALDILAPFARKYGLKQRYDADISGDARARELWGRRRVGLVAFDGADGRPVEQVRQIIPRVSQETSGFGVHPTVSANIGLGILSQYNLTFDYARQRMILSRNHLYGLPQIFNRAGIRLRRKNEGWVVDTVYPGSPAASAGMKMGDYVSTIDGSSAAALDTEGLWTKLKAPVGTSMALVLGPARHKTRIVLVLRDWL